MSGLEATLDTPWVQTSPSPSAWESCLWAEDIDAAAPGEWSGQYLNREKHFTDDGVGWWCSLPMSRASLVCRVSASMMLLLPWSWHRAEYSSETPRLLVTAMMTTMPMFQCWQKHCFSQCLTMIIWHLLLQQHNSPGRQSGFYLSLLTYDIL